MGKVKEKYQKARKNIKKAKESDGFGILSLVLGLFGVANFLEGFIGIGLSVLAIVFSTMQGNRFPNKAGGWGMILGVIGLVIGVIGLIVKGLI